MIEGIYRPCSDQWCQWRSVAKSFGFFLSSGGLLRFRPHTQRMLLQKLQHLRGLRYRPCSVVRGAHCVGHGIVGIAVRISSANGIAGIHDLPAIDDHFLFKRSSRQPPTAGQSGANSDIFRQYHRRCAPGTWECRKQRAERELHPWRALIPESQKSYESVWWPILTSSG